MQTFLPYEDFRESAMVIDRARLGKQRVEAYQLINSSLNSDTNRGWLNHPARLMWKDNIYSLCQYGIAICDEWISRGYKDTMRSRFVDFAEYLPDTGSPFWLGNEKFHISHRSNLLRKGRERFEKTGNRDILSHYRRLWPDVPDDLPYIWPITKDSLNNEKSKSNLLV